MQKICKLCCKEKKLIKAHIIPMWAFNFIKHDNHFFQISIADANAYGLKAQKRQDGHKDDSIL